jgi:hypothetical protein
MAARVGVAPNGTGMSVQSMAPRIDSDGQITATEIRREGVFVCRRLPKISTPADSAEIPAKA